jgi:hypothetical protein
MPNLTISPDTAMAILLKAREFDEKVERTDPDSGSNPSDDSSVAAFEFGPSDETHQELVSAISGLNDDEQRDLIALVWLGRGDFTLAQWPNATRSAADIGWAQTARFIAEIPHVSDYLEEGLSQFNQSDEYYLDRH